MRPVRSCVCVIPIVLGALGCEDLIGAEFDVRAMVEDAGSSTSSSTSSTTAAGGAGGSGGSGAGSGGTPACGECSGVGPEPPSCAGLAPCGFEERDCCDSPCLEGGLFYRGQPRGSEPKLGNDDEYNGPYVVDKEYLEHEATIAPFRLDAFEVTVGRFRKFVEAYPFAPPQGSGAAPCLPEIGWSSAWNDHLPASAAELRAALACEPVEQTWTDEPGDEVAESRPINCVDWYVSFAFCIWDGGRLPTEAEWEFAAAGGAEDRCFPWGSSTGCQGAAPDCEHSNSWNACQPGKGPMRPVGHSLLGASKWGHHDLTGNVWERVIDRRFDDYYSGEPCSGASCVVPPPIHGSPFQHRLRGASSGYEYTSGRAAARGFSWSDDRLSDRGFRCARN